MTEKATIEALRLCARELEVQAKLWSREAGMYDDAPELRKHRRGWARRARERARDTRRVIALLRAQGRSR